MIQGRPVVTSEEIWTRWGQWFAQERRARDITQEQVAKTTGLRRTHISDIENGNSGSKRDTVVALAKAIGVPVEEALARAGFALPVGMDAIRSVAEQQGASVASLPPDDPRIQRFGNIVREINELYADIVQNPPEPKP